MRGGGGGYLAFMKQITAFFHKYGQVFVLRSQRREHGEALLVEQDGRAGQVANLELILTAATDLDTPGGYVVRERFRDSDRNPRRKDPHFIAEVSRRSQASCPLGTQVAKWNSGPGTL